ncbi:hypothetical protein D9R12_08725 [Pseudoxanthomonas spadix]|nr:hypothetical protein D9R12_08725 [Pseudoxanthomonas spadix]
MKMAGTWVPQAKCRRSRRMRRAGAGSAMYRSAPTVRGCRPVHARGRSCRRCAMWRWSAADQIDENMAWMSVALTTINAVDVVDNPTLADEKTRAMIFAGIGTGGPALVAGAMLLLYQVAIALFVGLGPLFILCLLFDVTKSLFQKWLFYGLGTMFSMAVLAAMTSIALKMMTAVSEAFWGAALVGSFLDMDAVDGISSQAMQQGGLGLLLTTLIITAPPMAAMFFQGTLGQFAA